MRGVRCVEGLCSPCGRCFLRVGVVTGLRVFQPECPLCQTLEVITWYQPALFYFAGYGETLKTVVHTCQCGFLLTINTESVSPKTMVRLFV